MLIIVLHSLLYKPLWIKTSTLSYPCLCACVYRSIAWVCGYPLCLKSISARSLLNSKLLKVCTASDSLDSACTRNDWPGSLWRGGGAHLLQVPHLGTDRIWLVVAMYWAIGSVSVPVSCTLFQMSNFVQCEQTPNFFIVIQLIKVVLATA